MTLILYLCIALPILMLAFLIPSGKPRLLILYMAVGMTVFLLVGPINGYLLMLLDGDMRYVTTNITPITEELLKAACVLYYAATFSDDRSTLESIGMAEGIGFAIIENMYIFTDHDQAYSLTWAVARVIGATLMHATCTATVGLGMSFINKRRKMFVSGTFSLLVFAILFHGIFNTFVGSTFHVIAFLLPVLLYMGMVILHLRASRRA